MNGRPLPRVQLPHKDRLSQVLILDALMPRFEQWLLQQGFFLARMPSEDPEDITTYTVSVSDQLMWGAGAGRVVHADVAGREGGGSPDASVP